MRVQNIHFSNGNQAQAVIAPPGTLPTDLLRHLDILPPAAIIMLMGGAAQMEVNAYSHLRQLFTDGIAQVAASTGALIIDGGTQSGVMELIGQGVAQYHPAPILLGVSPAGNITYPGKLDAIHSDDVAPLDPNHSHFILVETDAWGGETQTMYELAQVLSADCPSVAILINGGTITKNEVIYNVRQRRPIIIITGSGRLADEIARLRQEKPPSIPDPIVAEIVMHGNIHLFPLTSTAKELAQLMRQLLST
jgi:hypothetical protein